MVTLRFSFDVEDERWVQQTFDNLGIAFGLHYLKMPLSGAGHDSIIGNTANNDLRGNEGNDSLNGGQGLDVLTGGSGQDTFEVQSGQGHAVVMDFTDGADQDRGHRFWFRDNRIVGNDAELLSGDDLIATVLNSQDCFNRMELTLF